MFNSCRTDRSRSGGRKSRQREGFRFTKGGLQASKLETMLYSRFFHPDRHQGGHKGSLDEHKDFEKEIAPFNLFLVAVTKVLSSTRILILLIHLQLSQVL
jgi:hypothetical protein